MLEIDFIPGILLYFVIVLIISALWIKVAAQIGKCLKFSDFFEWLYRKIKNNSRAEKHT